MTTSSRRRKEQPWLYRNSRLLLAGIALLGVFNTAYLTISRLTNTNPTCPTKGCELVLYSPYGTVFGQPLSLFGLLAYTAIAILALAPLGLKSDGGGKKSPLHEWSWLLLFIGSTAMVIFSGYLMYIMVSQFVVPRGWEGVCIYCIVSAIFALSLFVVTLKGRDWDDLGQLFFTGGIVGMVTLLATLVIYAPTSVQANGADAEGQLKSASGKVFFTLKNTSDSAEVELAQHLTKVGAKMYGSYWCPHCCEQKELFGKQAAKQYPYVECAADGVNSQTDLCRETGSRFTEQTKQEFGFPAWEIYGRFYPGVQKLDKLADLSNYQGSRNFKNTFTQCIPQLTAP